MSEDLHKTALDYLDIEFAIEGLSEKEEIKILRQQYQDDAMDVKSRAKKYGDASVDEVFDMVKVDIFFESIYVKLNDNPSPEIVESAIKAFLNLKDKRDEVLSWINRERLH